jgi:inner membrane protein involved in colicin E2 resistance
MFRRIFAIGLVYLVAVVGWVILGGTLTYRTDAQNQKLREEVGQLWGTPIEQRAPTASLAVERQVQSEKWDAAAKKKITVTENVVDDFEVPIVASQIATGFHLDQRQKGLLWYSTYDVDFSALYTFENPQDKSGHLTLTFRLPAANGRYDKFKFEVDGSAVPFNRQDGNNLVAKIPCPAKSRHTLAVGYATKGLDRFVYRFGDGISEVRNFQLAATTDFGNYDHPADTVSPDRKEPAGNGWRLVWEYDHLISGNPIGIETPQKINPGPMAARISFFAPVSLGFFFFLIFVIAVLRKIQIHPMNYFFLAASFFAFHLLLAYLVDHISIHVAFVICSLVSIFLVVSYMRLVTGSRFAYFEVAIAQVIYLIGFSYAFFFEGFTGLAVTVGSIITLFVVMQMTARLNWTEKFQLAGAAEPSRALK